MKNFILILAFTLFTNLCNAGVASGITLNSSTTLSVSDIIGLPVTTNGDILSIDTTRGTYYPEEIRTINLIKEPKIKFPVTLKKSGFKMPSNMESLLRYVDGDGSGGG